MSDNTEKESSSGDYIFTQDWFSVNIKGLELLKNFKEMELHMLEIGSFEGRSTVWFLENVLVNPSSTITCIDTFQGSSAEPAFQTIDNEQTKKNFLHNISKFKDKVTVYMGKSGDVLCSIPNMFHIIYIDGDHRAAHVLSDAVLAFRHLLEGGVIIFDDYTGGREELFSPNQAFTAVNGFMQAYAPYIKIIQFGYQVIIQKIKELD
jgi:predicted O-methyltransferase YrrM